MYSNLLMTCCATHFHDKQLVPPLPEDYSVPQAEPSVTLLTETRSLHGNHIN